MATILEVELRGKISDLKKNLVETRKELEKTGDVADNVGTNLEKETKKGVKGLGNLKTGTANVTPTILEFNRVIQDAPFGIQGVANNLTQLTQNFGFLQQSTGSTGAALKALLAGFTGPAGILFAVSAVTSLLVTYGDELLDTATATDKLAKATAKYIGEANNEIAVLKNLVDIAKDESQSKKVRLAAIEEINKNYEDYLGNLGLEDLATREVQASVDALTKSLIKNAQVRGLESALSEVYADAGEELSKLLLEQRAAGKAIKKELEDLSDIAAFSGVDFTAPLTEQIRQVEEVVNRNQGAGAKLLTGLGFSVANFNKAAEATRQFKSDLEKEIAPIQELLSEFTIEKLFAGFDGAGEEVVVTAPKINTEQLKNTFRDLDDIFGINEAIQRSLERGENVRQNIKRTYDRFGNVIEASLIRTNKLIKPQISDMEEQLRDFSASVEQIVRDNISNAFAGIGEAIGRTLVEGGNLGDALAKSLLGSIGAMLIQLGELAIATGVGILAVNTSLQTLNPYVAIAAGVALVALGAAFASGANKIGSSGGSQSSVSGQGVSSSSSGFSSVSSSSSGYSGDGTVVFEIQGTSLIGVLEKTRNQNNRLGG